MFETITSGLFLLTGLLAIVRNIKINNLMQIALELRVKKINTFDKNILKKIHFMSIFTIKKVKLFCYTSS